MQSVVISCAAVRGRTIRGAVIRGFEVHGIAARRRQAPHNVRFIIYCEIVIRIQFVTAKAILFS